MSFVTRRAFIQGGSLACLCVVYAAFAGCSIKVEQAETNTDEPLNEDANPEEYSADQGSASVANNTETIEPAQFPVGSVISTDKWEITLTDAYVSATLESSESSTSWTANSGIFLTLEFDVEALTSDKLTVDGSALTEIQATYNGNTYSNFDMKYLAGQLWISARRTYLDANIPTHIFVYTTLPESALNDDISIDVKLKVAGQDCIIPVR